jgi:hypothetical protein
MTDGGRDYRDYALGEITRHTGPLGVTELHTLGVIVENQGWGSLSWEVRVP